MASAYPELMERLIREFAKFPGIGTKSAERILFYLLKTDRQEVKNLAELIWRTKETLTFCQECNNLAQSKLCRLCSDTGRDHAVLCVVEEPRDVIFIEKTGSFHGLYHVLLGYLSPLEGRGPRELKIEELFKRIEKLGVKETILATNSNAEGETTALYLSETLKEKFPDLKVSRLARGVPMGSHLEYLDLVTLARAIEARTEIQ